MTNKFLIAVLAVSAILSGCNADFKKTPDGLRYKIFSTGKGEKFKHGQLLKVHFRNKVGDSTLDNTFDRIPAYGMYDSSIRNVYDFVDFLGEMRVGDSAVYSRSVDSMVKKGMMQYTNVFKKGGVIEGTMKVVASFPDETALRADQEKELKLEKEREIAKIEQYLKEKNIKPTAKTAGGVLVVIENEGTGLKADSGTMVKINYTGYLKSGVKFDSNVDSSFQHNQPYEFQLGTRSVIPGWDEGLLLFKAGGKGKLFVPALMGYGMQSNGDRIPAFSDLFFDVEVVDVKAAPPAVPSLVPNATSPVSQK